MKYFDSLKKTKHSPLWSLLAAGLLACALLSWLRQNSSLCNNYHVLARKFLLQFPNNSRLNFLEGLELRIWNPDNDGLLVTDRNLVSATDLQLSELWLKIC